MHLTLKDQRNSMNLWSFLPQKNQLIIIGKMTRRRTRTYINVNSANVQSVIQVIVITIDTNSVLYAMRVGSHGNNPKIQFFSNCIYVVYFIFTLRKPRLINIRILELCGNNFLVKSVCRSIKLNIIIIIYHLSKQQYIKDVR